MGGGGVKQLAKWLSTLSPEAAWNTWTCIADNCINDTVGWKHFTDRKGGNVKLAI